MNPFYNAKVIKKHGKTFLYDEANVNVRRHNVEKLQEVLDDAKRFLHDNDFPERKEDIFGVLDHGREGLLSIVWDRADREAARLKCRPYVAATWREQERESVTPEQWAQADTLCRAYSHIIDGLPFNREEDISEDAGRLVVDAAAILARVEAGCCIEITPEMKKDLNAILELADTVKAMELRGLNVRELIDKYIHAPSKPEESTLLYDIVFRRHAAGFLHDRDIDRLFNAVALNNPMNKKS